MIAGKSAAELQKLLDLVKAMRDVDWEHYTELRQCIPRFINKAASEIFTLVNDTLNKNQKE